MPEGSLIKTPASTFLFDKVSGLLKGVINSNDLTTYRTAAGSALATALFSNPQSKVVVIFGTGPQALVHLKFMLFVRKTLEKVYIFTKRSINDLDVETLAKFKDIFQLVEFVFINSNNNAIGDLLQKADIICTCTNSKVPVFNGNLVNKGTHINAIGSYTLDTAELDDALMKKLTKVLVDSKVEAKKEAGELKSLLQQEKNNKETKNKIIFELVNINLENLENGSNNVNLWDNDNLTLFKSVGVPLQDLFIADFIYGKALEKELGTSINF
ncbi:hypothetical protein HK099_004456 [Clydaea vesicula]|uniref:Ornithine cyclodeaminase n=1 Tax=Clydaea vesicula TaxID=447962 RepID=A0AAD5U1W6_9FUNG|nr:hypothetical protein HK099_004456 [Clydaea vesicula]